jgi:hypothetical protein
MLYSHYCPKGDVDVLDCLDVLFDANHDGTLTGAEIDNRLALFTNMTEITSQFTSVNILNGCDFNNDGVLTMDDWNDPMRLSNSTCLSAGVHCGLFCAICSQNGWTPSA